MKLTAGTLIIGSLYWDNDVREEWRRSRLEKSEVFSVTAPIRYGRKSGGRGNTYTMVFSPRHRELGRAKAIACRNRISSVSELVREAELLWTAERSAARSNNRVSAIPSEDELCWGCVALLMNPNEDIPQDLLNGWADRVSQEQNYGKLQYTAEDGPLISDRGFLQIPWPDLTDGHGRLPLPLLLMTATNPTLEGTPPDYPSTEIIALAWKKASEKYPSEKYDNYFWNNKKNGITTFQDDAIEQALQRLGIRQSQ